MSPLFTKGCICHSQPLPRCLLSVSFCYLCITCSLRLLYRIAKQQRRRPQQRQPGAVRRARAKASATEPKNTDVASGERASLSVARCGCCFGFLLLLLVSFSSPSIVVVVVDVVGVDNIIIISIISISSNHPSSSIVISIVTIVNNLH